VLFSTITEIAGFYAMLNTKRYRAKWLKGDLAYWLENLEKKFVYNHCQEKYRMNREEVDKAIFHFGYENITVKFRR